MNVSKNSYKIERKKKNRLILFLCIVLAEKHIFFYYLHNLNLNYLHTLYISNCKRMEVDIHNQGYFNI